MKAATKSVFEGMAEAGRGDAGALALGLRHGVTGLGLRALAAKAVHVAAAAPDRMIDIYDNAAAGWLGGAVFPPRLRTPDALPISPRWWNGFWRIVGPSAGAEPKLYAQEMMRLAGELNPAINARMAAAALEYPGIAEAAAGGVPEPYDLERLAQFSPASLAFAVHQEFVRPGSLAAGPYWNDAVPYLRHMPPPLNAINVQVIQSMPLWGLIAGYSSRTLDRVAFGGFLMGQVGHHYSALASAVTLTSVALMRPEHVEVVLDSLFKGWTHGRETTPLVRVDWEPLWHLRVDQARETLQINAFDSPYGRIRPLVEGWSTSTH